MHLIMPGAPRAKIPHDITPSTPPPALHTLPPPSSSAFLILLRVASLLSDDKAPAAGNAKWGAGGRYWLSGKLEALDSPGEWFLDTATREVWIWMPDGGTYACVPQSALKATLRTMVALR